MTSVASMTGYGFAQGEIPLGTLCVECRSVNSRFLDVLTRCDEGVRFAESEVRSWVQKSFSRGKVEVRLTLIPNAETLPSQLNMQALERMLALQNSILAVSKEAKPLTVAEVMALPGVATVPEVDRDEVLAAVKKIVHEAFEALKAARLREGAALTTVLQTYCASIRQEVQGVRQALPKILAQLQEKLTQRLEEALSKALTDKSTLTAEEVSDRIRQEVTFYAVKMDVDEEMNRLETHVSEILRLLASGGAIGRKLDFMAQEMNREANTLGSKAAAIDMTNAALALKITIDQMREQIQNIE